nr:SET and MYND domain-containing protein 4-like [Nerophis lumbriciformis]
MDLPCLPWQDHVRQKWTGLEPETRERFKSLLVVEDVFESALSLTTQDDVKCLGSISAGQHHIIRKDAVEAAACRERGNASFKCRKYMEAVLHYSQGVCLSPKSSDQLPLCYANRSAALFHLHRYEEALDDMSEAERNDYPTGLAHKLEKRRADCLVHISPSDPCTDPEESSGMSPKANVGFILEKGRHVVASETIQAGEVILSERPYSFVLIRDDDTFGSEHRRCHACLNPTWRPIPCGGCSYERYCGARCRDHAWEEYHRWECPLGVSLPAVGVLTQLALRVALKAGVGEIRLVKEGDAAQLNAAYIGILRLLHHLDQHSASMRFLCAVTVATLCLKLQQVTAADSKELDWRQLGSTVFRHLLQLRCNAQAIVMLVERGLSDSNVVSHQERRIATALFPTLSLINHSCRPNTSVTFSESGAVTVRANQNVPSGREVLHCYGPHASRMLGKKRRRLLQEQYFFLCKCEACEEEQSQQKQDDQTFGLLCATCLDSLALSSSEADSFCRRCGRTFGRRELTDYMEALKRDLYVAEELLERDKPYEAVARLEAFGSGAGVTLAPTHILRGRAEDVMAKTHASNGDWSRAAVHMERSSAAVIAQFGEESVEMARHLAKLAQLHFNAGSKASALCVIPEARRLLSLHCGALCPQVQELQAMEECLQNSTPSFGSINS